MSSQASFLSIAHQKKLRCEKFLNEMEQVIPWREMLGDSVPDETTILNFRHLLEQHELQEQFLIIVNGILEQKRITVKHGTTTDATIITAPPSTKNKTGKRDPEMHQTKKGNQWHFGMKAHIGTDTKGFVHTVEVTKASVHDGTVQERLYHGKERTSIHRSLRSL